MDKVDLKQYLPIVYEGITESETQQDSLSIEINKMNNIYEQALMDQFIQTASLKVLPYYENIFHIVANPATETVQFRRERILYRMRMLTPPYTYYYLKNILDTFFGQQHYKLVIDNNNFTIYLESAVEDSLWYHEIQVSITAIKPCNMIFINRPRISKTLNVNETIHSQLITWNYTLNSNWLLGLEPFVTTQGATVKMADIKSLQQPLFDYTLEQYKSKFYKAKINDSEEVLIDDNDKQITTDTISLEYEIDYSNATNITNIKLLDSEDNVLENSNVYIPVTGTIRLKHVLKIQEAT